MSTSHALRTLSIGGATYDLFVRTDHKTIHHCGKDEGFLLPLGDKIPVDDVIETCGGGAANTSVGLARLGCSASYSGILSNDQWGQKLLDNFKAEGVDVNSVTIVEDEVSSFSIILSASSGERVILYNKGTNEHLHDVTFDRDALTSKDWVYLNHIQEQSCVIQDDLVTALATDETPRFTWNPGGCQIEAGIDAPGNRVLLSHTDLLLLNKKEAMGFTRGSSIENIMQTLLEIGAKNICITDGSNGTWASDGAKLYHCPVAQNVTPIDTTGAGDAFGTAVTWALINGETLPTAVIAGTINAASVVSAIGAQAGLLTDIDIRQRMEHTMIDVSEQPF